MITATLVLICAIVLIIGVTMAVIGACVAPWLMFVAAAICGPDVLVIVILLTLLGKKNRRNKR